MYITKYYQYLRATDTLSDVTEGDTVKVMMRAVNGEAGPIGVGLGEQFQGGRNRTLCHGHPIRHRCYQRCRF